MGEYRSKNSAIQVFNRYLEERGLRKTSERMYILETVSRIGEYFTVESLRKSLEVSSFHISRATVYNTLELLAECGMIRKHQFLNATIQYEYVPYSNAAANRYHLICSECGIVRNVKDPEIARLMGIRHYRGFYPSHYEMNVYGICSKCRRLLKNRN